MSKKYIAYGSNLSVRQMAHRCPDARIIGMAAIQDWKLVFRTHATIEPAAGRVMERPLGPVTSYPFPVHVHVHLFFSSSHCVWVGSLLPNLFMASS